MFRGCRALLIFRPGSGILLRVPVPGGLAPALIHLRFGEGRMPELRPGGCVREDRAQGAGRGGTGSEHSGAALHGSGGEPHCLPGAGIAERRDKLAGCELSR